MILLYMLLPYLVLINVLTFCMYGIDKWKAKRSRWRVPETTLLEMAVLGGSIGAWLGMRIWHHKTMHNKFKYGIPIILVVQIVIFLLTSCKTKHVVEPALPIQEDKLVQEHSSTVFLIMYDSKIGKAALLKSIKDYECEIVYDYVNINGMALKKPEGKTLEETMQYFREVKGVLSVEYNYVIRLRDPIIPRLEIIQ